MKNIMETVNGTPSLSVFAKSLAEAGLVDELNLPGPYTVFAPSDDAFASMPHGSMDMLLKNAPYLQRILHNHLVKEKYDSNHFVKLKAVKTMADSDLHFQAKPKVTINGAKVLKPNLVCSNGIIHIIDHVLMVSMGPTAAVNY
ncbi:MAG TPA: fasciclin domain-containing protein [Oligoflexus sp.]|uniref:fasciclin domain-containing protein n=1 Tax=Oligoflexus sp. TaxID=1971216 RepID=UPI002D54484F|nr:fasciclin domain-containing protein [Oligoflexus sp.]HYX37520.1 fasciclin domain-containing protein [Oligoflexus sp.]